MSVLQRQRDARSSREICCVSPPGERAEMPYFEAQAFAGDGRYAVIRRCGPAGWRFTRVDLVDGSLLDLAPAGEDGDINTFSVGHDDRGGWFLRRDGLYAVDVCAGGPPRPIGDLAARCGGELILAPVSLAADDRFCALASRRAEGAALWRYDLLCDELLLLAEVPQGLSHPMINPTRPDLVSFVPDGNACWDMELPDDRRARTWLAELGAAPRPFLTPARYRTITHESWSPDGERLFFFDKTWRVWTPVAICSVDAAGGDLRQHFASHRHRLGHGVCSPCGRYFVADCQQAGDSPLILIDLHLGGWQILCWPDASQEAGHAAQAHVHAGFSADGRRIAFTSDREGIPRAYVIEVGDLIDAGLPYRPQA